jgi:hypothetical protein
MSGGLGERGLRGGSRKPSRAGEACVIVLAVLAGPRHGREVEGCAGRDALDPSFRREPIGVPRTVAAAAARPGPGHPRPSRAPRARSGALQVKPPPAVGCVFLARRPGRGMRSPSRHRPRPTSRRLMSAPLGWTGRGRYRTEFPSCQGLFSEPTAFITAREPLSRTAGGIVILPHSGQF